MPDLFVHYASGDILTSSTKRRNAALFTLGAILPDLLSRLPVNGFRLLFDWNTQVLFHPLHTPFGWTLATLLIAFLLPEHGRGRAFLLLWSGALLHQTLDLMQAPFYLSSYTPLFPFSLERYHWPLFYYNDSVLIAPVLVLILWFLARRRRAHSRVTSAQKNG
ncbi:MAG: hypothetical protein HQL50_06730 [Magnetococcales bacterium]|nr:hypothetical protein [Magnetococcales bacterium]